MFGKTTVESPSAAIGAVFDDSTNHDTAHIAFAVDGETVTIQYLNRDDPPDACMNVVGFGGLLPRDELLSRVPFDVQDDGPGFVVFESAAQTPTDALGEVWQVADVFGQPHPVSAKTFECGKPTFVGNLKSILGIGN